MKNLRFPFLFASTILLASCGLWTASTYHHSDGGDGYDDTPIDSTTYHVMFYGNGNTNSELVDRYALYRAAELTVSKGYDYFVVIDAQHDKNSYTSVNTGPEMSHTEMSDQVDPMTGKLVPVATTTTTQDVYTSTTTTHSTFKTIRMFKGARPAENANAYDAKSMLSVMGPSIQR